MNPGNSRQRERQPPARPNDAILPRQPQNLSRTTPMPLIIETPEAAALVRGLARLTGENMTEAITIAPREQ